MKRTLALMALTAFGVLVLGGGALAARAALNPINCSTATSSSDGVCYGTNRADEITGRAIFDKINALAGNDTVRGNGGNDQIYGGRGNDTLRCADSPSDCPNADTGNLTLIGGPGSDALTGMTRGDLSQAYLGDGLYGDDGDDTIDARDTSASDPNGTGFDFINAGAGNDTIFAADNSTDHIECGAGKSDSVTWDQGKDQFFNTQINEWQATPSPDCEHHNP